MAAARARTRASLVLGLVIVALAAKCGGDGGNPTDPGSNPGGGNQATNGRVTISIRGLTGNEREMSVRYTIGDVVVTRAGASGPPAIQTAITTIDGASIDIPVTVPVGKIISVFAMEAGQGRVRGDLGAGSNPQAVEPLQHEFVAFGGDCVTNNSFGECSLRVAQAKDYTVRVDYRLMRTALFRMVGAGLGRESFISRDQLALPNRPLPPVTLSPASGVTTSAPVPRAYAILPNGSTFTFTALFQSGDSKFLRWDGPCATGTGGTSLTCTLQVGADPGPVATAVFEYYLCANGFISSNNGPGCSKISP